MIEELLSELYTESDLRGILKEKSAKSRVKDCAIQTELKENIQHSLSLSNASKKRKIDFTPSIQEEVKLNSHANRAKEKLSPRDLEESKIAIEENKRKLSLQQRETKRLTSPLYSSKSNPKRVIYVARKKSTKHGEDKGSLWALFEERRKKGEEVKDGGKKGQGNRECNEKGKSYSEQTQEKRNSVDSLKDALSENS